MRDFSKLQLTPEEEEMLERYAYLGIIQSIEELDEILDTVTATGERDMPNASEKEQSLYSYAFLEGMILQNCIIAERCLKANIALEDISMITHIEEDSLESVVEHLYIDEDDDAEPIHPNLYS